MTDTKDLVKVENNSSWDEALEKESWIAPMVNIYETDEDFHMEAFMPDVDRDKIKVKLEEGSLVIMGRINYDEAVNRKYILNEYTVGNYYRKFRISDSIDNNKIEAKFENGVLSVKLPKHDRVKPRTIEIN
jgi:HSP20 family protein